MDWLQNLRLQNIFQPQSMLGNDLPSQGGITGTLPPPPSIVPQVQPFGEPKPMFETPPMDMPQVNAFEQPQAPTPNVGLSDVARRMQQYYTPDEDMSNRMEGMLNEFPTREQNKPGWLRKIGAGLVAGTTRNAAAGREILDRPYDRKLKDWQNKFDPTHKAATLERQQNVNERTLAYQTIAAEIREEAATAKAANDEKRSQIAQQRANVYEFKAKNPGHRIVSPKGGFVTAIDPISGKATIVTDSLGKPIPTGTLSDEDMQNLQHDNRTEEIKSRGDQTVRAENVRQEGRETIQSQKGWSIATIPDPNDPTKQIGVRVNAETGEVKPITLGGKSVGPVTKPSTGKGSEESSTQKKVREFLAARQLVNTMPELKKWIKFNGVNDFRIVPPGGPTFGGWGTSSGPTQEEYNMMHEAVYGIPAPNQPLASHTPSNAPRAGVTKRTLRNKTTGQTKTQVSTDGGKTWKDE